MVEIISVHVQKTAGSAFGKILEQVYSEEEIYFDYAKVFNSPPDLEAIKPTTKIIHGHFLGKKYDGFFPEAQRIVWLRHPVSRVISHYFYWKNFDKGSVPFNMENIGLLEFAGTPEIRNHMTPYVENIDKFSFVGIQEFFKEDLNDFRLIMGWKEIKMNSKNKNSFPNYNQYIQEIWNDRETINGIIASNQEDMELYNQALELRAKRKNELNKWNSFYFLWQKSQANFIRLQEQITDELSNTIKVLHETNESNHQKIHWEKIESSLVNLKQNILNIGTKSNNNEYVWKGKVVDFSEIATDKDLYFCYKLFLCREPDEVGMKNWKNRISKEQMTTEDLVLKFIKSSEFKNLFFGITSPKQPLIPLDGREIYINYLYKLLLRKKPTKGEKKHWINHLEEKKATLIDLVREFISNSEYSVT